MNRRHLLRLALAAPFATALPASALGGMYARSRKKGVCMVARADGKWMHVAQGVDARWFYSWGGDRPANMPPGLEFAPMIWGYWGNDQGIAKVMDEAVKNQAPAVLGFNEPDNKTQSHVSVDKALDVWPKLMRPGMRLGSPGCVHPDGEWMKQFMLGVEQRKLQVDFICVHSYGGTNLDGFIHQLENVHRMYKRPVWITELAVADWGAKTRGANHYKPEQIAQYVRRLLPRLEALPFLERYAWFHVGPRSAALGPSALYNDDGSLTVVGEAYKAV